MSGLHVRPLHMWTVDVERAAGVSRHELLTAEWKQRFALWQDTGETVESAAAMLRAWPWPRPSSTPVGAELKALRAKMERMVRS